MTGLSNLSLSNMYLALKRLKQLQGQHDVSPSQLSATFNKRFIRWSNAILVTFHLIEPSWMTFML